MPAKKPVKWSQRRPPVLIEEEEGEEALPVLDWSKKSNLFKLRRQRFVHEYVKDFNATRAYYRMGYECELKSAQVKGSQLLRDPYTQQLLGEFMKKADEKAIVTKADIIAGLYREANADDVAFSSNASTRIAALKHLSKLLGMEVTNATVEVKTTGGVMMVPLAATPEEWARAAKGSQATLKNTVRQ